jgi:integrase
VSPVHIKTRTTKSGKRYVVYYRRGGRQFPLEYGGSFPLQKHAIARRDLIAGEIAAGRDPRLKLAELKTPATATAGLDARWDAYIASRTDVTDKTRASYRDAKNKWLPILGTRRDPHTITADEVIAGVAEIRDELSPATAGLYLGRLRLVLDFCDVDPNPARSTKVKRPRVRRVERSIPSNEQWHQIRGRLRKRSLLIERLQEACAFRVSEAAGLEWGDFDFVEGGQGPPRDHEDRRRPPLGAGARRAARRGRDAAHEDRRRAAACVWVPCSRRTRSDRRSASTARHRRGQVAR